MAVDVSILTALQEMEPFYATLIQDPTPKAAEDGAQPEIAWSGVVLAVDQPDAVAKGILKAGHAKVVIRESGLRTRARTLMYKG